MTGSTIAAIATPEGAAGVGMVRLSGPRALAIAGEMIRPARAGRRVESLAGYTGLLGRAFDERGDIDDAVVFVYRAPRSYTGEDAAEICCHGGTYLLRRVLHRCVALGASPAGPGEFTRRAYLNGKISLTGAEAVANLIAAGGGQAAAAALAARDGAVQREADAVRDGLLAVAAELAAWIDFPDELPELPGAVGPRLEEARARLERLLRGYENGVRDREGVATAIIGRPNVGKSTLMNLLTGEETSIVTSVAGTTRDVVESVVRLGGATLRLWDTAGIRDTADAVEAEGVARARRRLAEAQLVLVVLDGSAPLEEADLALLRSLGGKPAVAVVNKADLGASVGLESVAPFVSGTVRLSARTGEGAGRLEEAVRAALDWEKIDPGAAVLQGERQHRCALNAANCLDEARRALGDGATLDAVDVCVEGALEALAELTGARANEQIVDEVFSRFCVGK